MAKIIKASLMRKSLDTILAEKNILDQKSITEYMSRSSRDGLLLEDILIQEAGIPEDTIYSMVAESYGLPFINPTKIQKPEGIAPEIEKLCFAAGTLPMGCSGTNLSVLTSKPGSLGHLEAQISSKGLTLQLQVTPPTKLAELIHQAMPAETDDRDLFSEINELAQTIGGGAAEDRENKLIDITETKNQHSVVQIVNRTLAMAVKQGVSDIHIESTENGARVRFRIDGVMVERLEMQRSAASGFISRMMVMAALDITERTMPQDGSFKVRYEGNDIEFRIASIPGLYDQNITLRMLSSQNQQAITLTQLGLRSDETPIINEEIKKPYGMILVSGPTGSGKSTTLYAILETLAEPSTKIITIEDPVERRMDKVMQIGVHINRNDPERSLTFARGLRTILRLDPDIIMVGEIRDKETAEISIQASLTGHLVLSTVHANSSLETLRRMQNMGVDPFLMVSSLNLVIAQRLIRRLCPSCRQPRPLTNAEKKVFKNVPAPETVYEPGTCKRCMDLGYRGRIGLYELLQITEPIRDKFLEAKSNEVLLTVRQSIKRTLLDSAIMQVAEGNTNFDELERICGLCR